MKILLPTNYKYIGFFIVLSSIVYELNRSSIDISKGLFSLNIGLILILISKNDTEKVKVGDVFLFSFLFVWVILILTENFTSINISTIEFITIVQFFTVFIRLILTKTKLNKFT